MFLDIPLTTWLLYIGLALIQIYWSLLAIFNTFDSYLGFKFQVRDLIAERDDYKLQAETYAEAIGIYEQRCEKAEADVKRLNAEIKRYELSHDQVLGPYRAEIQRLESNLKMWQDRCKQLEDRKDR